MYRRKIPSRESSAEDINKGVLKIFSGKKYSERNLPPAFGFPLSW
jgi:hypothetical protein